MQLLTILVIVTLALSVVNVFVTFNLQQKINGAAIQGTGADDGTPLGNAGNDLGDVGEPQAVQVSLDDDAVKGNANAQVTMVEFSDYECPFCGRFYQQTLPLIIENYVNTGKVKMVFRDFPLGFHPNAQKAAEAAECAGEQDKYWEYHDKLFENQQALSVANLKQYAAGLGLDTVKFNQCLDSGAMASEVQKDMSDGSRYGVDGTPAFFINGKILVGAQPYEAFKEAIDAELSS